MALNSGIQTYQILTNNDDVCISSLSSTLLAVQISGSWPSRDITIIGWKQFLNDHSYIYGSAAISLYEIFLKILTLWVNVLPIYRGNTRWWIEIGIHSQNGFNPLGKRILHLMEYTWKVCMVYKWYFQSISIQYKYII